MAGLPAPPRSWPRRCTLGRETLGLRDEGGTVFPRAGERTLLRALGGRERVTLGHYRSRAARCAAVLEAIRGDGLLPLPTGALGRRARPLELVSGFRERRGDLLVLPAEPIEEIEVVHQVRERRRAERERDQVGRVGLVDLPHTALERLQSDSVLPLEHDEAGTLRRDLVLDRR